MVRCRRRWAGLTRWASSLVVVGLTMGEVKGDDDGDQLTTKRELERVVLAWKAVWWWRKYAVKTA